jgi:hypothetical protein
MEIRMRETAAIVSENEFRGMFPDTSFPQMLTLEIINNFGGDPILEGAQPIAERYQTVYRDGVEQIDGKWFTKYSLAEMSDDAKAALDSRQARSIRADRNEKLSSTDWTQLADSTADKQSWATYRQALRDLPAQEGFPWSVVWPVEP